MTAMSVVPAQVLDAVDAALSGLGGARRRAFHRRLRRWYPDLAASLARLYPDRADEVAQRAVEVAAVAYAVRPKDLRELDETRILTPDWLQRPSMVGYACYADRFAGTLRGVGERTGYLRELGVTYLHLMPLLLPREGDNDGGYAVADYRTVRPDLGTTEDLAALATQLRGEGISLVLDLVLNHVAREHEWAARARAGEQRYRDYFHIYPDRELPDAYETTLPEVFRDFAPGNFTWDDEVDGWVWTTFNEWQWDVSWANPEVLLEYADIICFLGNLGVEVVRLDAIAFTWKRLGTTCQNQPEVHDITQALRLVARLAAPAMAFKAEAIVGPRDLLPYLGTGRHTGLSSDLAYHNTVMVQAWNILATGDVRLAKHALAALPPTPPAGTWITYLRCHDDIGWAIDDGDAQAVGVNGWMHRRYLADWYAGEFPGSWARGLTFQFNAATGDKRTSGTAASLVGFDAAAELAATTPSDTTGYAAARDQALARLFLANAFVFGWGGLPVIWSGDELGMSNDPHWMDEPGHEDDNRWAHRPRLDWDRAAARADLRTDTGKVFASMVHLAQVRASRPELHAVSDTRVLTDTDDGVLAIARAHPSGPFVGLYNVAADARPVSVELLRRQGITAPFDALSGHAVTWDADGLVWLPPYAARWVVDQPTS